MAVIQKKKLEITDAVHLQANKQESAVKNTIVQPFKYISLFPLLMIWWEIFLYHVTTCRQWVTEVNDAANEIGLCNP